MKGIFRNTPVLLCGMLMLSACTSTDAGTGVRPAGFSAWEDVDGLSGATLARVNDGVLAYVDRVAGTYVLKTLSIEKPGKPAAEMPLGDNAVLTASNGSVVAVLGAGTGDVPRAIRVYDQSLKPVGQDRIFPGTPLNHPEGAFALTDNYIVSGFAEGDKTWIGVFDLPGARAPGRVDCSDLVGKLITLTARGDYIIAGGSGGTAIYRIDGGDLTPIPVSGSDGKPSHWLKSNGFYAMESKEGGAEVKIWRWGSGIPEALGSVTVPDIHSASAVPVKALQFDRENPHAAYMV
ncbi:MAG: hypothetical protein LBG42_00185, partial [Treponema sp.]|nr:hypothetical protein [Treponema sp.]